jgi:glycosyltransferase involved in cell wall biosynthesis
MRVSVIIPTFNRQDSVLRLLDSLCNQTITPESFEVIVVEDGSTSNLQREILNNYSYKIEYIWQENQGATIARNIGATNSRGQILIFVDDDISLSQNSLELLADVCDQKEQVIALGTLIPNHENEDSIFTRIALSNEKTNPNQGFLDDQHVSFLECKTGVLAIKRKYFFELNMMRDPTGGWPNWDDIDFGYRAYKAGFDFIRVAEAKGLHWDNSLSDLDSTCQRWYRASMSAVRLFQNYPELRLMIPMYADKTPINRQEDSISLMVRKVVRIYASSQVIIALMRSVIQLLEKYYPRPKYLRSLYRWICGAYMYQGFQEGLKVN